MEIQFNYENDTGKRGETEFSLHELRKYLMKYWENLVVANHVKAITDNKDTRFVFDWKNIFSIAVSSGFIIEEFFELRATGALPDR